MTRRRLILGAALVAAVVVAVGIYAYEKEKEPIEKRGSASEEFVTTDEPQPPPPEKSNPRPWPTYGYNVAREHISPYDHRPPFRRLWKVAAHDTLEFPPSVGYGHVYLAQQKGLFFALDAKTGKVDWRKSLDRCAASSPTVGKGVVYQSYMHPVQCLQDQAGATGFVVAWDAKTGHERWRFKTAPIESSPLLKKRAAVRGQLGPQGACARRRHRPPDGASRPTTRSTPRRPTGTGASSSRPTAAPCTRSARAPGGLLWSAQSQSKFGSREFWYATPTIAYGRVYIGNTDGTMYVFGAKSGRLLWARPLGTYIYGGAAVYKRRVFVGTYDGKFYALDAATGDTIWQVSAHGAVHAAPTVMDGLVYYAVCSSCGSAAARAVARGPDSTYAVRASDGKTVWHFGDGKYANPVVADDERIYVTGQSHEYALAPRKKQH